MVFSFWLIYWEYIMRFKILKVNINNRVEYHILRPDNSLIDIELDYGRAWVRLLVYENIDK